MQRLVEFGLDRVPRSSGTGPLRASDLDHESGDDAVKNDAVVKADFGQTDQILRMSGSDIGIDIEQNLAHRRIEFDLVLVLSEVHIRQRLVHFCSSIGSHNTILFQQ